MAFNIRELIVYELTHNTDAVLVLLMV